MLANTVPQHGADNSEWPSICLSRFGAQKSYAFVPPRNI